MTKHCGPLISSCSQKTPWALVDSHGNSPGSRSSHSGLSSRLFKKQPSLIPTPFMTKKDDEPFWQSRRHLGEESTL